MDDYEDPAVNWQRLIDTQAYLTAVARGQAPLPDPNFYREHARHIAQYLIVVTETPECDQEVVPYLDQLIDDFGHKGYFPLNVYLIACTKLIGTKLDYDLERQLSTLTFS